MLLLFRIKAHIVGVSKVCIQVKPCDPIYSSSSKYCSVKIVLHLFAVSSVLVNTLLKNEYHIIIISY